MIKNKKKKDVEKLATYILGSITFYFFFENRAFYRIKWEKIL
jgi:hypothetical protein